MESGLTALKKGLETETQERKTAVTAAKQEASQALTSAVGALESSKADKTALAQLQAQVDGMPFVKLQEITVSQGGVNQIDVDVSQIQWAAVCICAVSGKAADGRWRVDQTAGQRPDGLRV